MDNFITALKEKHQVSLAKYPPELWAELDEVQMIVALRDELDELWLAMRRGDMDSPHSVPAEAVDVANVAARIAIEMRRRAEAKCIT